MTLLRRKIDPIPGIVYDECMKTVQRHLGTELKMAAHLDVLAICRRAGCGLLRGPQFYDDYCYTSYCYTSYRLEISDSPAVHRCARP